MITSGNYRLFEKLPQVIFGSLEVFDLLAIPLFILLGEIMNEGGITRRIITPHKPGLRGFLTALPMYPSPRT